MAYRVGVTDRWDEAVRGAAARFPLVAVLSQQSVRVGRPQEAGGGGG